MAEGGDQSFSGVETLTINPAKVMFREKDLIGSGGYGLVYRATDDGIHYDDNVVVKKIRKTNFESQLLKYLKPMYKRMYANVERSFRNEVMAQERFSHKAISPRIFYVNYDEMYYVMEKMDQTLGEMIRENEFTPERANKLIDLLERSFSTNYIHKDLSTENVMWSDKDGDFRLIDWGMFILRKDVKDPRMRSVINDGLIWILQWMFKFLTDKDPEKWSTVHGRFLQFVRDNCFYDDEEKCLVFSPKYADSSTPEENVRIENNIKSDYPGIF